MAKAGVYAHLNQQRVCGPPVNNTPAHLGPILLVSIVTIDGIQTASCWEERWTNVRLLQKKTHSIYSTYEVTRLCE